MPFLCCTSCSSTEKQNITKQKQPHLLPAFDSNLTLSHSIKHFGIFSSPSVTSLQTQACQLQKQFLLVQTNKVTDCVITPSIILKRCIPEVEFTLAKLQSFLLFTEIYCNFQKYAMACPSQYKGYPFNFAYCVHVQYLR